ncbi:MAG: patatin-like phospholipase family protein [Hyphomicrobium sp.]
MKTVDINLALQGGGAHGAFTWGVLDRLLEDARLKFGWVSATSAGAVNAVGLASGLAQGSREKARETLYKIWQAVHKAGVPDLLRLNPFLNSFAPPRSLTQMASLWSPYEFNPLGFDPLRRLLEDHVDFELIRANSPFELLIAATHVNTGRARLFRQDEITVEAVLASACLPAMHHAVEINGAAYWDGGFSANPDLVTLASESPVTDTLLVTVAPSNVPELPTTARDIAAHTSRLQFNAPLLRDVEIITAVRESASTLLVKGRLSSLCKHRFHLIDGGAVTGGLNPESIVKPDWNVITYLHGAGRNHADEWLKTARASIGRHETVDLARYFFPPFDGGVLGRAPSPRKHVSGKRASAARAAK